MKRIKKVFLFFTLMVFLSFSVFPVFASLTVYSSDQGSVPITAPGSYFDSPFFSVDIPSLESPIYCYIYDISPYGFSFYFVSLDSFVRTGSLVQKIGKYYVSGSSSFSATPASTVITDAVATGHFRYLGFKDSSFNFDDFLNDPGFDLDSGTGKPPSYSSIKYDPMIPAPEHLKFTSSSSGGFIGFNKSYKHHLTWNNSFSEPFSTKIMVNFKYTTSDGLPQYADFTLSRDVPATLGSWVQDVDQIKEAIMAESYSSLNFFVQYRVQFYRVVDGVQQVGPVGVVHLNKNFFGDYTGSTVTTEKPLNSDDPGDGMDSMNDNWSSDGEDYVDYDKDGNVIGGGSSSGSIEGTGDILSWFMKTLQNIPKLLTSFFTSLQNLFSGIGQVPAYIGSIFSFLPSELIQLIGLGLSVVIVLRIVGR